MAADRGTREIDSLTRWSSRYGWTATTASSRSGTPSPPSPRHYSTSQSRHVASPGCRLLPCATTDVAGQRLGVVFVPGRSTAPCLGLSLALATTEPSLGRVRRRAAACRFHPSSPPHCCYMLATAPELCRCMRHWPLLARPPMQAAPSRVHCHAPSWPHQLFPPAAVLCTMCAILPLLAKHPMELACENQSDRWIALEARSATI